MKRLGMLAATISLVVLAGFVNLFAFPVHDNHAAANGAASLTFAPSWGIPMAMSWWWCRRPALSATISTHTLTGAA